MNKTAWYIVGGIAALIGLYFFIQFIAKYAPKKNITDEINVEKGNLSYPNSQYLLWVDQLKGAMDGAGTDEQGILNIITQILTLDDWNMLVRSFGTQKIRSYSFVGISDYFSGTLPSCLRNELKESELVPINTHLAKIGVKI